MEQERSEAEHVRQRLHGELLALVGPEAPGGWRIVLIKISMDGADGEAHLDHVDSTGHVLWHDSTTELRRALHQVLWRHREAAGANWTRASLVLSEAKLVSADFR